MLTGADGGRIILQEKLEHLHAAGIPGVENATQRQAKKGEEIRRWSGIRERLPKEGEKPLLLRVLLSVSWQTPFLLFAASQPC
jgi:hypothetical protein